MILNSIRWRLQVWHGLILACVVAGFGFTAYQLESAQRLRRIDQELQRRISLLVGMARPELSVHVMGGGGPGGAGFGGGLGGGRPGEGRFEDNRPAGPPPDDPPLRLSDLPRRLDPANLFAEGNSGGFYYLIWQRDGHLQTGSTNAPTDLAMPARVSAAETQPARLREGQREFVYFTPTGRCILVGCPIGAELADLRRLAWVLAAAGGSVLALGLAGGWWLASRAIRPIEAISATAVQISAGDLSQRINTEDTDNELGRLAGVLNSTFARLETAFAQQARFTADAAHELRTPVTVMLTHVQNGLAETCPNEAHRESFEACQRAALRMRRLIESLLELARLDAGQEPLQRMRFDLASVAADAVELVRPLATERQLQVHGELAETPCDGDFGRLSQVLVNLLTNAIVYNRPGGEIRVSTRLEQGHAVLTVSDTGVGITAEHLPRLFDRFYRVDAARTTSSGRTGLGLAISKSIVDAHGGTIEVSSQAGEGTTFKVRLPPGG